MSGYGGAAEYIPAGPCGVAKVRHFAESRLRYVSESPQLLSDKTRFMGYMESLTNDILGVRAERSSPTSRIGVALEAPSSSSSGSLGSSTRGTPDFVSEPISADLREPSYSALGKLQHLRQNVAAMLGGGSSTAGPAGFSPGRKGKGDAAGLPPRQQQRRQLHMPRVDESQPVDGVNEYPFSSKSIATSASLDDGFKENDNPVVPVLRSAPSPLRVEQEHEEGEEVASPALSVPSTARAAVAATVANKATDPVAAKLVSSSSSSLQAAAPKVEDGELDFSGTWKGVRGERGRYTAKIDTTLAAGGSSAGRADSQVPLTTITLRGSVDLSGMSLEGLKSLTGHY